MPENKGAPLGYDPNEEKIFAETEKQKIIREKISSTGEKRIETIQQERNKRDLDNLDIEEKEKQYFGFSVYTFDQEMQKNNNQEIAEMQKKALSYRLNKMQDKLIGLAENGIKKNDLYSTKIRLQYWFNQGLKYEQDPEKFIQEKIGLDYTDQESREYLDAEIGMLTLEKEKITEEERSAMRLQLIIDEAAELCSMKYIRAAQQNNKEDILSDDILLTIIKNNIETWKKQSVEFEKEAKIMKEKFMYQIKNKIDNDELSLPFDYVKKMADTSEFQVVDPVSAKLREVYGDYVPETHTIRMSLSTPKDVRQHVFTHEMTHALSGKQEILSYYTDIPKQMMSDLENIRVGTRLKDKFTWLNEALTEKISLEIIDKPEIESVFYTDERKILNFLIDHLKIPKELFYDAYFENFDPEKENHKQPNLKKLFEFTNKNFGHKFLVNLDKLIEEYTKQLGKDDGLLEILKTMKNKGDDFPEYLNGIYK